MLRKHIAGLCLAALLGGCAGLPTIDVSSVNTTNTGVNTTAQVSTAPQPPLALEDQHANWSDFGETPAGAFTVSSLDSDEDVAVDFVSGQRAADLAEQAQLSHVTGEALSEEGTITRAMMVEDATDDYDNWSDFGESPPALSR